MEAWQPTWHKMYPICLKQMQQQIQILQKENTSLKNRFAEL